ncbi:unnamed protein product, partial [marine sediment metagenome]
MGDPTWTGNYILYGTHRTWAKVMNEAVGASSIMKFTGKTNVVNLNFNLGTGTNGLIMTHGGFRVYRSQFVGEDLTSAKTALHIDGATAKHGKVVGCDFLGEGKTQMTGILVDNCARSLFEDLRIHDCKAAIQIINTNSDDNLFHLV